MAEKKTVRDIMVDVFEYPHLPYWFTIKQALGVIRKTLIETEKCVHPRVVLVFDEKYNLIGMLTLQGVLRGLGPVDTSAGEGGSINGSFLGKYETELYSEATKKILEEPISKCMTPIRIFLAPDDPVIKAALLMLQHDLQFLPVLEQNQKLIGIVRTPEVFGEVFSRVLLAGRSV